MPNHIRRFLVRFALVAVVDVVLVLSLIAAGRLWHVSRAAADALKFSADDRPEQVLRALQLARRWAPAYPAFSNIVDTLYTQAHQQTKPDEMLPSLPERRFTAPIPAVEKALIPADMLVNLIYRKYSERQVEAAGGSDPELRPGPDEEANRPSIALHSTQQTEPSAKALSTPIRAKTSPPPAPQPAYDANAMWGTVRIADAPLYDRNGRKIREIPAGSLVDVKETRNTASGSVLIGSVHSRSGRFADVILKRNDVEIYRGYTLTATSKEKRQLASRRGEILAAISSRRETLEQAASNRNPHQAEYREILRQYKTLSDKAKALKTDYEKTTGNKRMELANELRTLKNEQFTLMPKYQEIKRKKQAWDRDNPNTRQDMANDPQIRQLNRQLEQIDQQLQNA